ncbi:hypothetical protein GCM10027347_12330 [Larkinella harenae]
MTSRDCTKAQLVIVTGLLVLHFVFNADNWLYAAVAVGLLSVLVPAAGNGIAWLWFRLADVLGFINSRIVLTILFGAVLVPIAWLYRLTHANPLSIKRPKTPSLYHQRNHTYGKADLEHPW